MFSRSLSPFRFRSSSLRFSRMIAGALAVGIAACSDAPATAPDAAEAPVASAGGGAPKFWEAGSSVYWNRTGRELIATSPLAGNVVAQARLFTYLSIAQYNAVVAAEIGAVRGDHPSPAAAAAAASARVLKQFLPALSATIDARLAAQLASEPWPGEQTRDVDAGLAIGEQVGAEVLAYAATDNVGATPAPPVPVGQGRWTGSNSATTLYGARWLMLDNGAQVMPPAPPAFGSPAYFKDLQEIQSLATGRTADQIAIAKYWAPRNGTAMNEVASDLIVRFHRKEREAARIFALANIASFDAINACFVAKFAYYYVRPTQADPSIAFIPGLPLPNHPSYPSGHSCITGSFTGVLAEEFPSETRALDAMMEEAGLSRMYAGFHFRFDVTAGQELGRAVARIVMQRGPGAKQAIALD